MDLRRFYESEAIVEDYIKYRPRYSDEVRNVILDYMMEVTGKSPPFDLMVDLGCGSGQATNLMAPYFKKVLASDISEKQIEMARAQNKFDHVTYSVGRAEEVDVEDHCVDLVLSAEAAQWFDLTRFFREVSRIIKGDGCLVIMGYIEPELTPVLSGQRRSDLADFATATLYKWINYGDKIDTTMRNEMTSEYSNTYAKMPTSEKCTSHVNTVYPSLSLAQIKSLMRSSSDVDNYHKFKAQEILAIKGSVSEEDMKSIDVTECFEKEIKEKLGLDKLGDAQVVFEAAYRIFIRMAHKLSFMPDSEPGNN